MALRIIARFSDGISRWQPFDAPLFGHNTLVASHDEDLVVSRHLPKSSERNPKKSLADSGILAKRKDLIARNQKDASLTTRSMSSIKRYFQPVAFEFEATRLVSVGEIRRPAALDVMCHHASPASTA
jgi:hypothetical protein